MLIISYCNNYLFYRVHNQVQKPAETNIQFQKPPPKKRGRKRRIDVQNEKLQETSKYDKLINKFNFLTYNYYLSLYYYYNNLYYIIIIFT